MSHDPDDDLRRLLDDAVSRVEPADRLGEIRERTRTTSAVTSRRRGWLVAGGGVLAAAAAAAVVVAVVTTSGTDDGLDEAADPATSASTPASTTASTTASGPPAAGLSPSGDPSRSVAPEPGQPAGTTPVYYVGDGPDGPDAPAEVLYRYFEPAADPLELLMSEPTDPDYRTLWPEGSLLSFSEEDGRFVVLVDGDTPVDDELARQQLVYTLQGATGSDLTVQLQYADDIGITIPPIERAPELDVLSHMSISDPGEDFVYDDDFTARGRANGFEGTVFCQLLDADGEDVWSGAAIAGGLLDSTMNPWRLRVDLDGVAPGRYTFRCQTDDPTGGAEGRGSDVDTRTITVE
ncbi:hypothetical protein GCM10023340_42990 [Nocardioides marinquilinus]|uniref:GerMN domain-containing protein n=1 Tax=Nocardioides marinquilinus TaxID=1210400 RepID=A0ABP9Q855_9ACTN